MRQAYARGVHISGSSPSSLYPTPQTFSTSASPRPCLAELAAKTRGVRVERPRPRRRAVLPHLVEELLLREHALGLARELDEELVLLLGQVDSPAADTHVAGARVDAHRPRLEHLWRRRPRAAQHGVDPLDELLIVERPRDVVVAALPEGVDAVDRVCLLRPDHDHRRVLCEPVDVLDVAREHEVEPTVRRDEQEPVLREVTLQLGLARCEEQCG